MCSDLAAHLPRDKSDTERAEAIGALGFPAVEPIIPALLEWMQDMNWPVARVLQPFLAGIGTPLYPHLQRIMQTDDDVWKNWILRFIIAQSAELQAMFRTDLERLATHPTAGEQAEGLDVIAKELLSQRSPAGAKRNPG